MPITIASAQTDIEIINQAIMLCGRTSIVSVQTNDKFSTDAAAFYGSLVQSELSSNRWRFALKSASMGTLTTLTPDFEGWQYYWDLPGDLLMLHRIDPWVNYTVFGERVLTTTQEGLTAVYSQSVPVSKWPDTFKMYIIYALADMLAISVTTSDRLLGRIREGLQTWQARALFADGQNSPTRSLRSSPWVNARFKWGNGSRNYWSR